MRADGYTTIGIDRHESPGADVSIELDMTRSEELRDLGSRLAQEYDLKAIIHNAAMQPLAGAGDTSIEDWFDTLRVNVIAADALAAGTRGNLARCDGSIVVIGSVHARATTGGITAYATTKAALEGWVRSAALDLGPSIRVNAIAPGAIDTAKLREGFARWGETESEVRKGILRERTALGRIGDPEEIAAAASFLIGDDAKFITGITLVVDGGASARLGSE
jgi:NAD(P)-dependent dehydrogenase (short-subunit alcohol dehydrogenase family)